jgi:hypothetical protein
MAHCLEESPGFVTWFNARVTPDITQATFWAVNATALLITVAVTLGFQIARSPAAALVVVAWLSLLMLANAVFHITAAIVDQEYVPGLVTAVVLYLPFVAWVTTQLLRSHQVTAGMVAAAAVLGAIPMAVHGYRIVFLGSRLF